MLKHDSQFVTSLVEHCNDQLDLINEYDSYAEDFVSLFEQHRKLTTTLAPLMENQALPQADKPQESQSTDKKVLDADGNELTGAALEANLVINAILQQYQNKTAKKPKKSSKNTSAKANQPLPKLSNVQSIYADAFKFVRQFTKLDDMELFGEMLSPESVSHDVLLENLIAMSQVQSIALNRQIVHVGKNTNQYCDLNCLLNTCDVLDNLPTWSLVLDLSNCPECAPIEGLVISRITYLKANKVDSPFTSSHHDEDIFLEELGLSLNIRGKWFTLGLAATLDNDRTISDLVRELSYYAADQLEQIEVPPLSEREQLDEPNWDEAEQIIDPKFNDDDFAKALYHAFKYVTYTITHLELIKDEQEHNAILSNEKDSVIKAKGSDAISAFAERLNQDQFKHYFI